MGMSTEEALAAIGRKRSLTTEQALAAIGKPRPKQEGAPQEAPPEQSTGDYVIDRLKRKGAAIAESVLPSFVVDAMTGVETRPESNEPFSIGRFVERTPNWRLVNAVTQGALPPLSEQGRIERERSNQAIDQMAGTIGYEGLQPQGEFQRYAGIFAEAAADPLNFVGMGPIRGAGAVGRPLLETLYGGISGVAGNVGGQFASNVAENLGAGEAGQAIAGLGGSLLGGSAANITRGPIEGLGGMALNTVNRVRSGDLTNDMASSEVRNLMQLAAQTDDGTMMQRIRDAEELMAANPGLEIAPGAILGDNRVIGQTFARLYSSPGEKGAKFASDYDIMHRTAAEKLTDMTAPVRGSDISQNELIERVSGYKGQQTSAAQSKFEQYKAKLDENMSTLVGKLEAGEDSAVLGKRASELMEAKRSAAEEAVQPLYRTAVEGATAKGVTMPANSVESVYRAVDEAKAEDVFATHPGLLNRIEKIWGPKQVEKPDFLRGEIVQSVEFRDVPPAEVDSLKRAINTAIREEPSRNKRRVLGNIRDTLYGEVENMDDAFKVPFKAANRQYYETVGIPFGEEGVKRLSQTAFETSVASQLSRPDQARDYIRAVGEEGIPVVRSAILMDLGKGIDATTGISPRKLANYIEKHAETIKLVPGLADELSDAAKASDSILSQQRKITDDYKATSREFATGFFRDVEKKTLPAIAQASLTNPGERARYLKDIRGLPPETRGMAMSGLKQSLIDMAADHKGSAYEFVQQNKEAYTDVFGEPFVRDFEGISKAFDLLSQMNRLRPAVNRTHVEMDWLEKNTGVPWTQADSWRRNPVMGAHTAASNFASKFMLKRSADKRDDQLMRIMLDPKALREARKALEDVAKSKGVGEKAKDAVGRIASLAAQRTSKGAAIGAINYEREQRRQEEGR